MHVLQIKDLKDLSFFFGGVTIDMQVLKDLKRCFFTGVLAEETRSDARVACEGPRAAVCKAVSLSP